MPIYLENKAVGGTGGAARHLYLVYTPAGAENDYSQYFTTGGYPTIVPTITDILTKYNPWGPLEATYQDFPMAILPPTGSSKTDAYPVEGQSGDVRAWAVANRNAVTVSDGPSDAEIWATMATVAGEFHNQFTMCTAL